MRYFGSKSSLAENVMALVATAGDGKTLCDPFGGMACVAATAKRRGYKVWTGDHLVCAHSVQVARIASDARPGFRRLKDRRGLATTADVVALLDDAAASSGWIVEEFSTKRRFFTPGNARRIEGCRTLIEGWSLEGLISDRERKVLRASLASSMDRVANTAGTYYAYLKDWSRKSQRPFRFELLEPVRGPRGFAHLSEADSLVASRAWDVLYLDPPYNARSYASYYHLPESICRGEAPACHGLSGVPRGAGRPSSDFTRPRRAVAALDALLARASAATVVFHYSEDGLIPLDHAIRKLRRFGSIERHVLQAPGYTTANAPRRAEHHLIIARA